jgi:hypothetical protein
VDHQKFGRKDFESVCTVLCFRASILNHGLRFSQDIQVADQEFPFAFMNFAINVLGMIGTFVFITMATPLLAFALPFLAAIGASFLKFYLATSKVHSPSTAPTSLMGYPAIPETRIGIKISRMSAHCPSNLIS